MKFFLHYILAKYFLTSIRLNLIIFTFKGLCVKIQFMVTHDTTSLQLIIKRQATDQK